MEKTLPELKITKRKMIISTPTPFLIWWTQVWLNLICGYLRIQLKVLNYKSEPYRFSKHISSFKSGMFQEV